MGKEVDRDSHSSSIASHFSSNYVDPAPHRLKFIRPWLLKQVQAGTPTVVAVQKFFGVTPKIIDAPSKGFAFHFFHAAATLGNEMFYITLLPFLFWYCPSDIARAVCFAWATCMYVGQVFKDYMLLPRPPMPPVVVLEKSYSGEYGFPSTHIMSSLVIPWTVAIYLVQHELVSPWIAYGVASFWLGSVTLSRLYLGVHSVTDLIGGFLIGLFILVSCQPLCAALDTRTAHSPRDVQIITPLVTAVLLLLYPTTPRWTSAYGDTATILGAETGIIMGCTLQPAASLYYGANLGDIIAEPSLSLAFSYLFRFVFGCVVLFLTRAVFKSLMSRVFVFLLQNSSSAHKALSRQQSAPYGGYVIEIPTKFVTYSMVGFMAVFSVPTFLRFMGM